MSDDVEKHLRDIAHKLDEGSVVLFLGAGASHVAGAPTGPQLAGMIRTRFPDIDQSLDDFIEICQDVIDTPPYNRNELEEYIRQELRKVQPSPSHKMMTRFDWAAIFTPNFDDLVEVAYRTTTDARKACRPVHSERFQVNPLDGTKVYLFKLMGSVCAVEGETGQMVLSRADYNKALSRRRQYLKLLLDFVRSGTIVSVGYSFRDRLVLDVMDEAIELHGIERLPWSYALSPQVKRDAKSQHMLARRRIIPVPCGFEELISYLGKSSKWQERPRAARNVHFTIMGHTLEMSEDQARAYASYFEILTDEKIAEPPGEKDAFFTGTNESWGAFREGWDFVRNLYTSANHQRTLGKKTFAGALKDRVSSELSTRNAEDNAVLLVTGMAGAGKTTLIRRLAWDTYRSGQAPVVFIKGHRISFDYKELADFILKLNRELDKAVPVAARPPAIKPLIIIDNAASLIRHVNRLKDYLTSRGRPALVLAAERSGEWELMWRNFPFRLPEENIYELEERLSDVGDEKSRIIEHFHALGYIPAKGTFWDDIVDHEFDASFFATMYTLVHPSRKPLNEIIRDQYMSLTGLTRRAFRYICCFHQFDLPINLELLVRSLGCSYPDLYSDVLSRDARKVIFEEPPDEAGNILFRSHHRIIARKTVEFFFGDPEEQKNIFIEVLKEAALSNRKERGICEKLLVEHIGPNAKPQLFSYEQQRQIFKTVCAGNPIRSLLHHWGILESDDHAYSEAETLLDQALSVPREGADAYRGESDQTILTSLGALYARIGIELRGSGQDARASEYFEKAERCFADAKHGEFPNAYAYHAHANMCIARASSAPDVAQALDLTAKAIAILSLAKDNVNEDDRQPIYELEIKAWDLVGDEQRIRESMELLRDRFNSASGYYLSGQLLWRKAQDTVPPEREKLLKDALHKTNKGLRHFPQDEHCLGLRAKLTKELLSDASPDYYQSLREWEGAAANENAWLLYELGRTSFILGYYDDSRRFFQRLETTVGTGHRLRTRPRCPVSDEGGETSQFEGTVISADSLYHGTIRCDSLRELRYPLVFRPAACTFTPAPADPVRFNIAFSFRGPIAVNVRRA